MQSSATTVEGYLAEMPDDRREAIEEVRDGILENLPVELIGEVIGKYTMEDFVTQVHKARGDG